MATLQQKKQRDEPPRNGMLREAHPAESTRAFLGLIGLVYDAAVAPRLWPQFLDQLSEALGGAAVLLNLRFPQPDDRGAAVAAGIDARFLDSYGAHYFSRDPWVAWAADLPPGAVIYPHQILPEREFARTEFYLDWLRPQRFLPSPTIAGVILKRRAQFAATIHLFRPWGAAPLGGEAFELLRSLMPHLQRAVVINRQLSQNEAHRDVTAAALDRLALAVILVDEAGQVSLTNQSAKRLLSHADGLRLGRDGLQALDARANDTLRALITAACRNGALGGVADDRAAGAVTLTRPSHRHPLAVVVTPLPPGSAARADGHPVAAVFISDPEQQPDAPMELLRQLYRLTQAEAVLACLLSAGKQLGEAAKALGVSTHTVRAQLKQIFEKTGASRQSALVRLLVSGPLALRFSRQEHGKNEA